MADSVESGGAAPAPQRGAHHEEPAVAYLKRHGLSKAVGSAVVAAEPRQAAAVLREIAAGQVRSGGSTREGGTAPGASWPRACGKKLQAGEVQEYLQGLRRKIEQARDDLAQYVDQVPKELAVELREGMLQLQRSASELAGFVASATPAAAPDLSRFVDGIDLKPGQREHPYRFHEDCQGGAEDVVPDPPALDVPRSWTGEQSTYVLLTRRWEDEWPTTLTDGTAPLAGSSATPGERTAARLRAALERLDELHSSCEPLAAQAVGEREQQDGPTGANPTAEQQQQQDNKGDYAARAPTMLAWLFTLPAQWVTANLGDTFGNFQTWKYSAARFIELGGSRFHPCDILCPKQLHHPRTGGTRTCCVVRNAQEVLQRMRAAVDRGFEPELWPKCAEWVAGGRKPSELPKVPAAALAELSAHDAIEGVFACFLYSFNLQCPNDLNDRRILKLRGDGTPGWKLSGLRVKSVDEGSRAALAGVRAQDVLLSVGGKPIGHGAGEIAVPADGFVEVVPARCEPRPLQLFGAVNWAMREAPSLPAESPDAQLLRRALSVFKPFIWRLDRFISKMKKRDAVLFRGVARARIARHYTPRMSLVYASFSSFTEKEEVAWNFAGEDGGTWLSLQASAALDIGFVSQYPAEAELILGSNTRVEVTEVTAHDVRAVLDTTNDAVSLVQTKAISEHGSDPWSPRSAADVLRQRVKALRAQRVLFSTFKASYVEPRVWREAQGAQQLDKAFEEFIESDAQWCVIVGAPGEGKSSSLLKLYAESLADLGEARGEERRVPLFVSLPLVEKIIEEEGWLRRQVCKQLSLDPAGWGELERRRMVVFADSADESGAPPELLRERSLAERSELPLGSKCCISVRDEHMQRMGLTPEDFGGSGCTVLYLEGFNEDEQGHLCVGLAERAAERMEKLLGKKTRLSDAGFSEALQAWPGCHPPHYLLQELRGAAGRGDSIKMTALSKRCAKDAAALTKQRLKGLDPRATENKLLYAMAAEAAQELEEGAGVAAVLDVALRRRMRRESARVDPAVWATLKARSVEERVEVLMRVAEAVAAALTLDKQWSGRIGEAAKRAAQLCEEREQAAVLQQLFPGLPLRTASAEVAENRFSLLHRHVHEWLAAQWAARAAERGKGEDGLRVVDALFDWAGAWSTAATAAQQVFEAENRKMEDGAERGPTMRRVLKARIAALNRQADQKQAAEELERVAEKCEKLYGPDALAAEAHFRLGQSFVFLSQWDKAVEPLRRALQLREQVLERDHTDTLLVKRVLAVSLIMSDQLTEGEELLTATIDAHSHGGTVDPMCSNALGLLRKRQGRPADALQCYDKALHDLDSQLRGEHHDKYVVYHNKAVTLESLGDGHWDEALELRKRVYLGNRGVLPQRHRRIEKTAMRYVSALYRFGRVDDAEAVLRAEGLWHERQPKLADIRKMQRERCAHLGAEDYAALLLKGSSKVTGSREWHLLHWPELAPEADEQLRRMKEGLPPYPEQAEEAADTDQDKQAG